MTQITNRVTARRSLPRWPSGPTMLEHAEENMWASGGFGQPTDLYFGGQMESAMRSGARSWAGSTRCFR